MPSAAGFGRKMESQVGGEVSGAGKRLGSGFGKMFALAGGALAAAGIGSFLKDSIAEAREAQKVGALTTSVIKATGGAANVTAEQVGKLAGALSLKTGIDDEVIQSGQNMLLTFKNVRNEAGKGNDIFNQSTKTLIDMSAAMGTEPKQAAIQLGKALNDPVKGISALSRVGVTFTEGQKETIKALVAGGDTMKAQKIILKELNSEFGGAAAAQATAGEKAAVAFGNLKEQIGTALLPVVDKVANVLSGKVIPAISGFVAGISSGKGAGGLLASAMGVVRTALASAATALTGTLLPALKNLWHALSPTLSEALNIVKAAVIALAAGVVALGPALLSTTAFINNHKTAVTALVLTVGTAVLAWKLWQGAILAWAAITKAAAAVQAAFNVVMAANPIGLVVVALLALGVGLVYAYKHSEKFRNVVNAAFGVVKNVVASVVGWFAKYVPQVFGAVATAVKVYVAVYKAVVMAVFNAIRAVVLAVMGAVKAVVLSSLGAVKAAFGALSALVGNVRNWFSQILGAIKSRLGEAVAFVKGVPGKIASALSGLLAIGKHAAEELIRGLLASLTAGLKKVTDKVSEIAGKIKGFFPGSPVKEGPLTAWNDGSPGRHLMEMLAKGIGDGKPKVLKAMLEVAEGIRDRIKSTIDQIQSDMASLKDSIAQSFAGDLFSVSAIAESLTETTFTAGQTVGQAFANGLADKKAQLKDLLAAFKKLKKWGLPPAFLSQLFASGNSALILEMAGGQRGQAQSSASMFGEVQSLSNQLGSNVAQNQYGPELRKQTHRLEQIEKAVKHVGADLARALDRKAAEAQRKKKQ